MHRSRFFSSVCQSIIQINDILFNAFVSPALRTNCNFILCLQEEEFSRWDSNSGDKTWVDFLAEEDMVTLRPLVFMELTALMDSAGLTVSKAKPPKRKRKEGRLYLLHSVFILSLIPSNYYHRLQTYLFKNPY